MTAFRSLLSLTLGAGLLWTMGCSSGESGDSGPRPFVLATTPPAVAGGTPLVVSGRMLAFLGSEITTGAGSNWNEDNGDTDLADEVAFMVNMQADVVTNLRVAAAASLAPERTLAYVNGVLFIVVDETGDSRDWNEDGDTNDRVLCFAPPTVTEATFLAELDPAATLPMVAASNQLVIQTGDAAPGSGRTNLKRIEVPTFGAVPTVPASISTAHMDAGMDGLFCSLAGGDDEVVAVTIDENAEGELNGDGDADDQFVLGLMDAAESDSLLIMTGYSVSGSSPALRVTRQNAEYFVGFLVDEDSMEDNYNTIAKLGSAWQPGQCSGQDDSDQDDEVLHWMNLLDFEADPVTNAPRNTGLVGTGFVFALRDEYVGTISFESDEGTGGGCDLNNDGDSSDRIFRWTQANSGAVPPGDAAKLHAVDAGLAGGSGGVIELAGDLWVVAVDETNDGRDLNGDGNENRTLVGVLDPSLTGTNFNFDQGNMVFAEPSWMAPDRLSPGRFLMALTERSVSVDQNGDGDLVDSIPTFPIEGVPRELDFPGTNVAVSETNAGIVTADGFGFYRARESSHELDYNNDGDMLDYVLLRVSLSGAEPTTYMGLLQDLNRPAVEPGPSAAAVGIGWVAFESQQGASGADLNGDGDSSDYVVRYARLP